MALPAVNNAKPAGYYDSLNHYLADVIPPEAKRILEMGCAEGRMGAWLKEQDPSRVVFGIEVIADVAERAKANLDKVIVGDAETMTPLPFEPESFDCVTFGDVIEHLREPGEMLRKVYDVLAPGGYVCICVPNVSHWSVVTGLMNGHFDYEDNGILDRTHLRFFTPQTMHKLLTDCGFDVMQEYDIPFANDGVTNVLAAAGQAFGFNVDVVKATTTTYQRVFKARKPGSNVKPELSAYATAEVPAPAPTPVAVEVPQDADFDSRCAAQGASVIILTYNSSPTLVTCLQSALATLGPDDEVIVVDNASTDGTVEFLQQIELASPQFRIIYNEKNLGFSAGCNVGIRAAKGAYVCLLNPDTYATPTWLPRLKRACADPSVGAIGPTSDTVAGLQKLTFHTPQGLSGNFDYNQIAEVLANHNDNTVADTKLLIGFCLMVKRSVLDEIGLLDENLFLGTDDYDWSLRIRNAGYRLVIARDAYVHHEGHVSFRQDPVAERRVRESISAYSRKLETIYGKGNVPHSIELFGLDLCLDTDTAKVEETSDATYRLVHGQPNQNTLSIEKPTALYLDLMKKALVNLIYPEADPNIDLKGREEGRVWPEVAHTMVGKPRLDNVQACVESVLFGGVPGDLVEAGVWRGGTSIFMRSVLKAHGITDRKVWVCDSFEGLPKPNAELYPDDAGDTLYKFDNLAVSVEQVQANFDKYGLLDGQVNFVKGWFKDTLHQMPVEQIAVLRLDGDMYESTMDTLKALYPKLSPGGFVLIDDFGAFPNCKKAVDDYRALHNITEPIQIVDWTGACWQKQALPNSGGVGESRTQVAQLTTSDKEVVDRFHQLYYNQGMNGGTWTDTHWMGTNVFKTPNDMVLYQELIHEIRPDLVIETGTMYGGSALFMAHIMDIVGHGQIVTVDINERQHPTHDRIEYLIGSSIAPEMLQQLKARCEGKERVMVILDSDHSAQHVLAELRVYWQFVTQGSYLIVEDGNVNGNPILPGHGPGPTEALQTFLKENDAFEVDPKGSKFLFTFNPNGLLRKK